MSDITVTIQTLKNDSHELKVSLSDTLDQLKLKIEKDLNLEPSIPAANMRVIHTGNILEDGDQTLEAAGISVTNNLLVVMKVRKKKKRKTAKKPAAEPAPTPSPAPVVAPTPTPTPTPAPESTPAPMDTTQDVTPAPEVKSDSTPAPEVKSDTSGSSASAASAMVVGPELQSTIAQLMGLGNFSMEQVQAALRAAFNNPDQAAEYLFTGIPANLAMGGPPQAQAPPAQPQAQSPQAQGGPQAQIASALGQFSQGAQDEEDMGGGMGGMGGQEMQQMLAQNPQFLQQVMANLSQTNPELIQQLQQNPQAFMQMMSMFSSMGRGGGGMPPGMGGGGMPGMGGMGRGGGGQGQGGAPPGAVTVTLTEAERQSVVNLQGLAPGISQQQALQAFLVCDRNETLAANYLLDQIFN